MCQVVLFCIKRCHSVSSGVILCQVVSYLIPQLEYLDLYLIHWPRDLTKDCRFPKVEIKPEEIVGYSSESISQCWEVCVCVHVVYVPV